MSGEILAIHGGAGSIQRGADREDELRAALAECLRTGRDVLAAGGSALDAVETAVAWLERHEFFNAGRGSALTATGTVEMDAAIMDGRTRQAGAVTCVQGLAHPVRAARFVLEATPHVLLAGDAARELARRHGLEVVAAESLVTPARREQLERARARQRVSLDHDEPSGASAGEGDAEGDAEGTVGAAEGDAEGTVGAAEGDAEGTVGAVARDARGHLAAATSTGGMTNQHPGRVGDTPLPGAGTWADDATCAVSGTGRGEAFMRCVFAHEVDAGIRLGGLSLDEACDRALAGVVEIGGRGGCVAVDTAGHIAMPFTTTGMYRGWIDAAGEPRVAILRDDPLDESTPAS